MLVGFVQRFCDSVDEASAVLLQQVEGLLAVESEAFENGVDTLGEVVFAVVEALDVLPQFFLSFVGVSAL